MWTSSKIFHPKNYSVNKVELWDNLSKYKNRDVNYFLGNKTKSCLFVVTKNNHMSAAITDDITYPLTAKKATYKCTKMTFSEYSYICVIIKSNTMPAAIADDRAYLLITNKTTYKGTKVIFSEYSLDNYDTIPMSTQEIDIDVIIMCACFHTKLDWLEVPVEINSRKWYTNFILPGYEYKLTFLGWTFLTKVVFQPFSRY